MLISLACRELDAIFEASPTQSGYNEICFAANFLYRLFSISTIVVMFCLSAAPYQLNQDHRAMKIRRCRRRCFIPQMAGYDVQLNAHVNAHIVVLKI